MMINYIHKSRSEEMKAFDTVEAYNKTPLIFKAPNQADYDKFTLNKLAADKKKGIILFYEVVS